MKTKGLIDRARPPDWRLESPIVIPKETILLGYSIFLANLAFTEEALFEYSKIGILPASAGVVISGWLLRTMITRNEIESQSI